MAPEGGRRRRGRPDDPWPPHRGTAANRGRRYHRHRRRERGPRTVGGRATFSHQGRQPPVRDLLQRWRRCLASLLFFTVLLTEHAGGALAAEERTPAPQVASPTRPTAEAISAAAAAVQQAAPPTSTAPPTAHPPTSTPPPDPPPFPPPPSLPPPSSSVARGPPLPDLSDVDDRTCEGAARDVWVPPPSEAVVDYVCPAACTGARNSSGQPATTTNQCLYYLEKSPGEDACKDGEGGLRALHLRHCCESSVWSALPPEARTGNEAACVASVRSAFEADELARRITCEFDDVLDRYDCSQAYSVRFGCDDCKAAYRRWVCSSLLPLYAESAPSSSPSHLPSSSRPTPPPSPNSTKGTPSSPSPSPPRHYHPPSSSPDQQHHSRATALPPHPLESERVWPCRGVCHTVEKRCPFVLPGDRVPGHPTQYAGEPSFICLDPNIPEIQIQLENSAYGDHRRCCYTYCPPQPDPGSATTTSFSSASFLLPAGDRVITNNGKGICFHCLRGRENPRSLTPSGGGGTRGQSGNSAAGDDGAGESEGIGGDAGVEPAPSGSWSSLRLTTDIHCWRLLVLQGLLLCLARRTLSPFRF